MILAVSYFVYVYVQIKRGEYVKWDGEWYTKKELKEKYPPQYNESVARNTPEEVYEIFRQALLEGNLELALEQITEQERDDYREAFKDKEKFNNWVKMLPENLKNGEINGNYAVYDIEKGRAHFFKDYTGYWKINSI